MALHLFGAHPVGSLGDMPSRIFERVKLRRFANSEMSEGAISIHWE